MKISLKKRLITILGWSLRELLRILRLWNQMILGPFVEGMVMIVLFGIFVKTKMGTDPESNAILIGLFGGVIGMTNIRNSFMISSSPLVTAKMVGYITDYTALPFSVNNLRLGMIIGSVFRCLITTSLFVLVGLLFSIKIPHPFLVILVTILTSILFSLFGVIVGSIFNSFEQYSIVNSYIIVPMSMLSGTFIPIKDFPDIVQRLSIFNPFFYGVDLMRYCFTGISSLVLKKEIIFLLCIIVIFWSISGFFVTLLVRGKRNN